MPRITVKWNHGMTVAVFLLVFGGALFQVGRPGTSLYVAGVGIMVLASVVYLGARIWMVTRGRKS